MGFMIVHCMELYVVNGSKHAKGIITAICFTDYVDLNTNDYGYNYYLADGFCRY